jgi:membrane peptidoglycan carboxypeptidase
VTRNPAPRIVGSLFGFAGLSVVAGLLVALLFVPSVAVAGEGVVTGIETFNSLPAYLQITQPAQASSIYAKQGGKDVKIATFYVENRTDVALKGMAKTLQQSTVDTEDPRFFKEGAIDVQGTIRGALATGLGHSVQGGSSITQQYVKNVLVQRCAQEDDQATASKCYDDVTATTPARKLREMRYAIGVEKKYSKDDILRSYLNIVGFGGTVYGVQAASEYYFGVAAKDLSLVQSATLTAILNNPSNLRIDMPKSKDNGAANHYAATLSRRNYVLDRMQHAGDITKQQAADAKKLPVTPKITPQYSGCAAAGAYDAGYFCEYVELSLKADTALGSTQQARIDKLTEGGLNIYTTLNLDLQKKSQAALSAYMPSSVPGLYLGAANVAVEPGTGRIVTMVQNTNFDQTSKAETGSTSVNYNTDANRGGSQGFQTGSSFKAFTLAAWLQAGHTLNESINTTQHDYPTTEFANSCANINGPDWQVSNADPAPASMSVMAATADSVNTAFAQMGKQLDLCNIQKAAFSLGVHPADPAINSFKSVPSMILGTNYIAPLTMATAYAGIANHGVVCTPVAIDHVTNTSGQSVKTTPTACTQGITPDVASGLADALQTVLQPGGTGALANPNDGVPMLAKTGTTDSAVQNWLVTSTTKIAQATWVGNVEGSAGFYHTYVNGVYGYNLKFLMDKPILQALDAAYGGDAFPAPPASEVGATKPPASTDSDSGKDANGGSGSNNNKNDGGSNSNNNNKGGGVTGGGIPGTTGKPAGK